MPPSAAAYDASALPAIGATADAAQAHAGLWFGNVPITETAGFPPAAMSQCWVYLTLNAEIALSLPGNPALHDLLCQPRARVSVDGQWLWWALQRKYPTQALVKLSGSDLIYQLATHSAQRGQRLLLVGSTPEVNAMAVMRLRERQPDLEIAGFAPAAYRIDSAGERAAEAATFEAIKAFGPDYVVFGLGADKEQRLSLRLAPRLDGRVKGLLCFGGAIDMASGQVRRAPAWMQRSGLEALYRVVQRPRRFPRLMRALRIVPRLAGGKY
jgi:N-acetylglucosaminyldiphosphoundecaprenol N-acetyl-beta-D-mannosaminyltransferase